MVEIRDDNDSFQEIICRKGKERSEFREMIEKDTVKFEVEEIRVRNQRKLQNSNYTSNYDSFQVIK